MRKYRINEIFYSVQGEGYYTGTPAVFIRFSGCNLRCPFCDTKFTEYKEMTAQEIAAEVKAVNYGRNDLIVFTGGEPTLQLDSELTTELCDYRFNIETNGTHHLDAVVDYITVSPKMQWIRNAALDDEILKTADELKVVVDADTDLDAVLDLAGQFEDLPNLYVQPCDTGFPDINKANIKRCVDFVLAHPEWCISLQTQKILNVR